MDEVKNEVRLKSKVRHRITTHPYQNKLAHFQARGTMRVGQYEVLLVKGNGDEYKERVIGDKTFVQGEEGQEYHVQVNVYQEQDGTFPAKYLRFGLLIDGNDIGSKKRLDLSDRKSNHIYLQPSTCRILGFPAPAQAQKPFTFALPDLTSEDTKYEADLGSVKLLVSEAHRTGKMHPIRTNKRFNPQGRSTPCISEDKKFYEQASLVTSAGKERVHSGARTAKKNNKCGPMASEWITVRDIPEATMVLNYHCKSTLDFLEEQESRRKRAAELVLVHSSGSTSSSVGPIFDLTGSILNVEHTPVEVLEADLVPQMIVDLSAETTSEGSSVEVVNGSALSVKRVRAVTVEDSSEESEEVLPFKIVKTESI